MQRGPVVGGLPGLSGAASIIPIPIPILPIPPIPPLAPAARRNALFRLFFLVSFSAALSLLSLSLCVDYTHKKSYHLITVPAALFPARALSDAPVVIRNPPPTGRTRCNRPDTVTTPSPSLRPNSAPRHDSLTAPCSLENSPCSATLKPLALSQGAHLRMVSCTSPARSS